MTHSKVQQYGPLVGRVLLSLLFLVSAFGMLTNLGGTAGYFASIGIPLAMLVVILVLIIKIGGALMIATGIHAKEGAWALIVFTLLTILIAHLGEGQLISAFKNLAIVGGLLMVIIHGAGPMSLEGKYNFMKKKKGEHVATGAAGGVCNCGNCDECRAARNN